MDFQKIAQRFVGELGAQVGNDCSGNSAAMWRWVPFVWPAVLGVQIEVSEQIAGPKSGRLVGAGAMKQHPLWAKTIIRY